MRWILLQPTGNGQAMEPYADHTNVWVYACTSEDCEVNTDKKLSSCTSYI